MPVQESGERAESAADREQRALERLRELGFENISAAFPIEDELDAQGKKVDAEIYWVTYQPPAGEEFQDLVPVEGKVYLPTGQANGELVIFSAGLPGGNAGRFERLYASEIVKSGYAFATHRFNGISLTGPSAKEVINAPERLERAQATGEHHFGGTLPEGHRISDIAQQPVALLMDLQRPFQRIHTIGHSMGAASNSISVGRVTEAHPEIAAKIGNVISLAGYVGTPAGPGAEIWPGMKMPMDELTGYEIKRIQGKDVNLPTDPQLFQAEMAKVAGMNAKTLLPESIGQILIYSPEDQLIAGPGTGSAEAYGPSGKRKLIVKDATALPPKVEAGEQHSMTWIEPANLVRALQSKVSGHGPHSIEVRKGSVQV